MISVIHDHTIKYPTADYHFSPDTTWPEYRLPHISKSPNLVYAAVRKCLSNGGLDPAKFGGKSWNPLGEYISPGNRVFILCNFVEQKVGPISDDRFFAKCTHGAVVRAVIDYVMVALKGEGEISFGNAPLQACDWNVVIQQTGASEVQKYYSNIYKGNIGVKLVDLRQHIIRRRPWGGVRTDLHDDAIEFSVEIDLGEKSLLDSLYYGNGEPKFRILDYDPTRTARCHGKGKHVYLINREIIESDVVISIPKLKTHEKVGITCGIKGCVGAVAHKDCLAHHRYGPPSDGGDEYPESLSLLRVASSIHDLVYKIKPGVHRNVLHAIDFLSRKIIRRFTRALSGSWPGNDTCWRMAIDLARILEYADKTGIMRRDKQRTHLTLTDGIISGEGDGPLSPKPVQLGYLCFSDNVVYGDYINALAMGFTPEKIPIIREAMSRRNYPLIDGKPRDGRIIINGERVLDECLKGGVGKKFMAPREWRNML